MATFTNQATLSYNGNVTTSNITTGNLLDVLSVTKTAVTDVYSSGEDITYVINLVNTGSTDFTGLTLTDNLGAYEYNSKTLYPLTYNASSLQYFINGTAQTAPTVTATQPLTLTGISVPAGGSTTVVYEVSTNSYTPLEAGSTVTNTVTVDGTGITAVTADETVTVETEPELEIIKHLSPSTVTENSEVTYTFTIQNYGNKAAVETDNAVITDTFDPILSNIAVTFNGEAWTKGTNYTYDETTGVFTTAAGQMTVDAAVYTQNADTGEYTVTPGVSTLIVIGTI